MSVLSYPSVSEPLLGFDRDVPSPHFPLPRTQAPNWSAMQTDWELLEDRLTKIRRFQRTLAQPTFVEGFGFWTGEDIRIEFRPAESNMGIVFVRTDLDGEPRIPALVQYRESKARQTSLAIGNVRVDMIEHLMAALAAVQVDNCEIWVDGPEMPGMDGSALPFYNALHKAGTKEQKAFRPVRIIQEPFRVGNDQSYIIARPSSSFETVYRYHLNFERCGAIGTQDYTFHFSSDSFAQDIMNCRTFLTKEEAEGLLSMGLCKRVTHKNVLVFDEYGPIGNTLHFPDECARHKVLDMVGDFALAPFDWIGEFDAHCSGHQLNADCVKRILKGHNK